MKNKHFLTLTGWIASLSIALVSCGKQAPKPVILTISAGTSMKYAMEEIKTTYTQEKPEVTINYTFDGGGILKQAIEQGKPVDIYITSDPKNIDDLQSKGFITGDASQPIVKNKIVLIVPKNTPDISSFKYLTSNKIKTIAAGNPSTSGSGKYANDVFTSLGILDRIKPKLILTQNITGVISLVENSKVDVGVVFSTEAILSNKLRIVAIAPENSHPPINFNLVILKRSQHIPEAKDFVQFLRSDRAGAVFVKYGFAIPTNEKDSK